ncbi:class I SAM-dependent methyltransferase [Methanoculleus taiwanensis]|uniref:class I SAM-dependent methyltransferase n=1 Tax=Methanoculleus taiwanensis TaxID=1550565 RepID=UPI000FFE63CA|nr:class I SAM-dependent methyltransferase [Methanoculleus taiwanensis]
MTKISDTQISDAQKSGSQELLKSIVNYWDAKGLCSLESSTSLKNKYIASFENFIESRLLSDILVEYCQYNRKNDTHIGLDVGAGLGRFSVVLARHLKSVYAIEPAPRLYTKLKDRCKDIPEINVSNASFESFTPPEMVDVTVVSGVLYLYNDEMISHFMAKLCSHLQPGGIVIIRDFIVPGEIRKIKSSYVKEAYCYYRNPDYWRNVAEQQNMDLIQIFRSVPLYNLFVSKIIAFFRLNRLYSLSFVKEQAYAKISKARQERDNLRTERVNTVFITLVKKAS